jgi:hypothetical protein
VHCTGLVPDASNHQSLVILADHRFLWPLAK